MKLSVRDQIIVAAALVVVLALVIVFLLIVPQFNKLGKIATQGQQVDQEIAASNTLLQRRVEAKQNAARTSAELLKLANQVPESPELPALIVELQDAADDSGLEFSRIAPAATPEAKSRYVAYKIDMTVSGRWADFIDFVRRIQKTARGVRVKSMSVAPPSASSAATSAAGETLVEGAIQIEVYTMSSTGATATVPPPASQ